MNTVAAAILAALAVLMFRLSAMEKQNAPDWDVLSERVRQRTF